MAFEVSGLSPGQHAIHLHQNGRCDRPDFASSGTHWNPAGKKHGTDNPLGPHDGDWDNLDVGSDGRGSSTRMIPRWHHKIPESGLSLSSTPAGTTKSPIRTAASRSRAA